MNDQTALSRSTEARQIKIRSVNGADLPHIVTLDERVTGIVKPDYWQDIFERFAKRRPEERFFLVAEAAEKDSDAPLLGYIVGEVRAWEFGSSPCGWVFAFSVEPNTRLQGIGEKLFDAISQQFRQAGIKKMRTMVARQNQLHMMFFRSEGMIAGPYLQLEKDLDE